MSGGALKHVSTKGVQRKLTLHSLVIRPGLHNTEAGSYCFIFVCAQFKSTASTMILSRQTFCPMDDTHSLTFPLLFPHANEPLTTSHHCGECH